MIIKTLHLIAALCLTGNTTSYRSTLCQQWYVKCIDTKVNHRSWLKISSHLVEDAVLKCLKEKGR